LQYGIAYGDLEHTLVGIRWWQFLSVQLVLLSLCAGWN